MTDEGRIQSMECQAGEQREAEQSQLPKEQWKAESSRILKEEQPKAEQSQLPKEQWEAESSRISEKEQLRSEQSQIPEKRRETEKSQLLGEQQKTEQSCISEEEQPKSEQDQSSGERQAGERQVPDIKISVRALVEFLLRSGDIDNRTGAGLPDKEAMQEGSRIHRKIQGRMGSNYRAEVPLSITLPGDGYTLTVEGRADGIFYEQENPPISPGEQRKQENPPISLGEQRKQENLEIRLGEQQKPETAAQRETQKTEVQIEKVPAGELAVQMEAAEAKLQSGAKKARTKIQSDTKKTGANGAAQEELCYCIDEIKGMYRDLDSLEEPYAVHLAQAKCYAYIYARQQELEHIGVQMTYCNLETEDIRRFRMWYLMDELEEWFGALTDAYRKWAEYQIAWKEIRGASIRELAFPFPWRSGQKKLAMDVYRTILRRKKLFIQAPTGTGKTLSTVYPAVKAVGEGLADRIFYATAKTITRTVAEEAFALLRDGGMRLKTLTITAKEKICPLEETECNPEACPYAKGHYDRVNDAVYELITSGEVFDRETILRQAQKWTVCPFEMSLDVSLWSDAIICDYNYIFDPRARLKRFFAEGMKGSYLFLIDEAHNLVDRGREMFSAALYKEDFLAVKREVKPYSRKLARALDRCNSWLLELKRGCEGVQVHAEIGLLPIYLMNLCGEIEAFQEEPHSALPDDKLLDLYFACRTFLDVSDRLDENYVIYSELCEDGRFLLKLYCVDISANLQECLDRGRSTVFFSATLLPIRYYKSLLSTQTDNYAVYAETTFRPEKRLVLLGTDTSSRYTSRGAAQYRKMAEYVLRAIRAKRGNYMVFFSSYRMLEAVAEQFEELCASENEEIRILQQLPGMTERAREEFLVEFEAAHENGLAGFCVMGGIFGEGIDLKAERLIGAIIVGTGLPQVCSERELLKQFYEKRGEDGFFYAYLCPGMNKVLQSAGRVIRTDEDEGVILLLDERFTRRSCREMFPTEWQYPATCTLRTVGQRLEQFWQERAAWHVDKEKNAEHANEEENGEQMSGE